MQTKLNPYLGFRDNARAAMEFYQSVFGGKLTLTTFKEYHASQDPSEDELIMHGELITENGLTLMGSDTPKSMDYTPGTNVSIALSGENEAELRGYWQGLVDGATDVMQLDQAPWGATFGMLTDKFGILWSVNILAPQG